MATLEKSHLSELHRLAAELGVERYRMLPREELIAAIVEIDPDAAPAPDAEPAGGTGADAAPEAEGDNGDRGERRPRRRRERGGRRRSSEREDRGGRRDREEREDEGEAEEEDVTGEPVAGVLDITPRGHGFIRLGGLESAEEDVYVSPSQIRRCELQRGDEVAGPARRPRRGERYPALIHVDTINGVAPGEDRARLADATPVHPSRRIDLAPGPDASADDALLLRSIDLMLPLALGQRVLVNARPGSGRTTLLRALAGAISRTEDIELVVLLIDERPEEVEAWRTAAPGADLAVATAEMRSGEQLRLVELAFGRASRKAEAGADVVLLVDSISRIAVAADDPGRVKPIFGAGRETADEGVGSLTVIATTLGDDGEDQGAVERSLETTENVLIVLDSELAGRGVFPAIDFTASRVAGEEHLRSDDELAAARKLRTELASLTPELASAEVRRLVEGSADTAAALATIRA
ncbi:MAG: Rho termination factor N-terminal domain-containing protein [Solirubrobacterales bacterium]